MSSLNELICFGFVHKNENVYKLNIPQDVVIIIVIFCRISATKIYCLGNDKFGSKRLSTNSNVHYLEETSRVCSHPIIGLFPHYNDMVIRGINNEIYGSVSNQKGIIQKEFKDFDKDNHSVRIINKGSCANWNLVSFINRDNDKQMFYGFGEDHTYGCVQMENPKVFEALNNVFATQKIIEISTGYNHSLFLSSSGTVFAYGENDAGQCGKDPDNVEMVSSPEIIIFSSDSNDIHITSISTGGYHNLCIDNKHALWVFGDNGWEQLGVGADYNAEDCIYSPMINPYMKDIKIAECGMRHSLCINMNGKAFTFGYGYNGQCGNGKQGPYNTLSAPYCINDKYNNFENKKFKIGSCGGYHTVLLCLEDQTLYGFGKNNYHQCGNFKTQTNQLSPYGFGKREIGIDDDHNCGDIVNVKCTQKGTIIVCDGV